jgi:hypothetical protein
MLVDYYFFSGQQHWAAIIVIVLALIDQVQRNNWLRLSDLGLNVMVALSLAGIMAWLWQTSANLWLEVGVVVGGTWAVIGIMQRRAWLILLLLGLNLMPLILYPTLTLPGYLGQLSGLIVAYLLYPGVSAILNYCVPVTLIDKTTLDNLVVAAWQEVTSPSTAAHQGSLVQQHLSQGIATIVDLTDHDQRSQIMHATNAELENALHKLAVTHGLVTTLSSLTRDAPPSVLASSTLGLDAAESSD